MTHFLCSTPLPITHQVVPPKGEKWVLGVKRGTAHTYPLLYLRSERVAQVMKRVLDKCFSNVQPACYPDSGVLVTVFRATYPQGGGSM